MSLKHKRTFQLLFTDHQMSILFLIIPGDIIWRKPSVAHNVEDNSIIILGDFNIDLLGKHPHQESWLSVIDNYELSRLVTNHTRVKE